MKKSVFFALAISLAFSVMLFGDPRAEASEAKPVPPAQQVPPLKDDIDTMMQQRAVQRSAPGHSEHEQDEGEGDKEGADDAKQDSGNQD